MNANDATLLYELTGVQAQACKVKMIMIESLLMSVGDDETLKGQWWRCKFELRRLQTRMADLADLSKNRRLESYIF